MTLGLFRKNSFNRSYLQEDNFEATMNESHGKDRQLWLPGHKVPSSMNGIEVVRSASGLGMPSCPCCKKDLKEERQTLGETGCKVYGCIFDDDGTETETCTSCDDTDEEGSTVPGLSRGRIPYMVTNNLVQGWILKKGTGKDWVGSRGWKPRWAVLSLARISGHEVDVPILQIFWHPSSSSPSTVIHLDSAVILPEDVEDKSRWNAFRFQIRHVRNSVGEPSVQSTRVFGGRRDGRDAWCQAICTALLLYEKEKARARTQSGNLSSNPGRWRSSSGWATGDAHPSTARQFPPQSFLDLPTPSPRSPPRDLPRHEPCLIGECLLASCLLEEDD